ncbi:MAG: hypothetical protein ABI415_02470 [Flavitalea sp.]
MDRIAKLIAFLGVSPSDAFLQHALALEYIKIGDDIGARTLFESILDRDPKYIGSYYHLAKLLERMGDVGLAVQWYQKGIEAARAVGDKHAMNELVMAYQEITD